MKPTDYKPGSPVADGSGRLGRGAALVFTGTGLSRLAGLLRDVVIFSQLGVSPTTDALVLALRIPATFYRYAVDAGLVRLLVPQLVRADNEKQYLAQTFLPCVLAVGIAAAFIWLCAPWLVTLLAPGFTDRQSALAGALIRLVVFYIPLALVVGYFTAVLNSRHRYGVPAYMQALLNLVIIASAVALVPQSPQPHQVIVRAMLAGGFLQVCVLLIPLWRSGAVPALALRLGAPFRSLMRGLGVVLTVTAPQQLGLWISFAIGSLLAAGVPTQIYLAERLVQFPLALIGIGMATILLPVLARQAAAGQQRRFARTLDWALKVTAVFVLPAAVGMWLTAEHIVQVLFGYRAVSAEQIGQIAAVVRAMVLSLPCAIATQLVLAACFSRSEFRPMLISALIGAVVLVFACWLLALRLNQGAVGIGLGVSLGALATAAVLLRLARIQGYWTPEPLPWLLALGRICIGCAAMGWAVGALDSWGSARSPALLLTLQVGCGVALYFAVLWLLGLKATRIWKPDEAAL